MIVANARNWLLLAGYAVLACAATSGGVSAATDPAAQTRYSTMSCEQLGAEYLRLDGRLLLDGPGAGASGASQGVAAATRGAATPSAESTARAMDRSMAMSEALREMDRVSAIYRAMGCTPRDPRKAAKPAPGSEVAVFAAAADVEVGRRDYTNRCAMCHGAAGKGKGWLTRYLKQPPHALTRLKKNANGEFPFARLYDVIDGRQQVAAHGPREMPVWGPIYRREAGTATESFAAFVDEPANPEGVVRARIYALLKYIQQFQE